MDIEISFIIKKIISVGIMPLTLGVIMMLISLIYIMRNNVVKAKRYLLISLLWLFLISYAPFANLLLSPLEKSYPKLQKVPDNIEYILLLGGDRKRRAWEALRLYKQSADVKIITSGFSMFDSVTGAEKTSKLLIESGVKKEDLLTQGKAKDTYEEAKNIKLRLGNKPFVLVTSAYHMPRSMMLFQKQGLNPIAAPADFNNPNEDSIFSVFESKQLQKTEHAWHEYIGMVWMFIKNLF